MTLDEWREVFELSDRYGFVIASDECYSELYFDDARPPLGALEAAQRLGRAGFARLIVFSSLSKRSNVPGMRSGFVAGDAALMKAFLLYRTYHGSAMSPAVQAASEAAWRDEAHVVDNRRFTATSSRPRCRSFGRRSRRRCRTAGSTSGSGHRSTTPRSPGTCTAIQCDGAARELSRP